MRDEIISLETRFAFQEKMIDELNEIVYNQQKQIDFLMARVPELMEKMQGFEAGQNVQYAQDETPPPHY